ncbi:hypothetical protein [uncultured Lacinutrix sp.]|uniref:hypothetical protein n=1 Tax=uncultured Lacinutrix sp. TaxID=574032 RepID=UPI00262F4E91|nr:hypothetical protein [uncultured Lacinutrix sp.]
MNEAGVKKRKFKKKVKKTRNWLTKNKVFFEVFSFLFLGIASLVVGWFSYKTSQGQLELLKLEQSPIINIQRDYNEVYEFININNVGHHLFEANINYTTYFIIRDYSDSLSSRPTDFYFKIGDYFGLNYETNNTIGNISRLSSSEYTLKERERIRTNLRALYGDSYRISEFEHFIKINYKNNKGDLISKHYLIDPFSVVEISKSTHDSKQRQYGYHSTPEMKYLNTLNHIELVKDIRKIYDELNEFGEHEEQPL